MGHRDQEFQEELEKLRVHTVMAAAEPHAAGNGGQVTLGLVFLRYVCAAFEELHGKIVARHTGKSKTAEKPADPELPDAYREAGIFFVPEAARWGQVFSQSARPTGTDAPDRFAADPDATIAAPTLAEAIKSIETENPALRDLFSPALSRQAGRLPAALVDFLSGLSAGEATQAFDYFLHQFGGAMVPAALSELLVAMLEPYKGRFCDPCCGSAALLAGVADFAGRRQGKLTDLAFYAQERDVDRWRLAKMSLLVRGIDTTNIRRNADSPLQRDLYRDLKFDFLAAVPPFKDNAYPWIRYVLDRLSPTGLGALALKRNSLSSATGDDQETRRSLVEGRLVDCVVNLPARLFPGHSPGPCLWFLSRDKIARGRRGDEVLFIDARSLGKAGRGDRQPAGRRD
ncbi:MAG: type I restriction-modification system subunit M, partial [Treponema sp.]|nr:type I restriction-modification system subunit M [Treponema sp.]